MIWRPENWQQFKRKMCARTASENQAQFWIESEVSCFEAGADLMGDAICTEMENMKNPYPTSPKFLAAHNGFEVFRIDILAKLRGKK